ncbi:hypothetical protein Btru_074987 [Bulinus truncatus]|nr:hypothetical protein Btru_074987 [Bulinus truncatus]
MVGVRGVVRGRQVCMVGVRGALRGRQVYGGCQGCPQGEASLMLGVRGAVRGALRGRQLCMVGVRGVVKGRQLCMVTGVMTQGRGDGTEWVTRFTVSYSMDAYHWSYVTDNYNNQWVGNDTQTEVVNDYKKPKLFEGNTDSFSVKHNYLDRPIIARYIKFHTIQWNRHPSMRVEIMGCQLCKEPLGLPPYGKMSASTSRKFQKGSSCQPEDGHILSSKSWCSKKQNAAMVAGSILRAICIPGKPFPRKQKNIVQIYCGIVRTFQSRLCKDPIDIIWEKNKSGDKIFAILSL